MKTFVLLATVFLFAFSIILACGSDDDDAGDDADDDLTDDDTLDDDLADDDAVSDDDVVDDDAVSDDDVVDDDVVDDDVVDDDIVDDDAVDDDVIDDDVVDDDIVDDDVVDDDVIDDDTFDPAPLLSSGRWYPSILRQEMYQGELWWCSTLYWTVCDRDNDLLIGGYWGWGGEIFIYNQYGEVPGPMWWMTLHNMPEFDLSDVSDCNNPVEVHWLFAFIRVDSFPQPYQEVCFSIESNDGPGNWSNTLENICVIHDP